MPDSHGNAGSMRRDLVSAYVAGVMRLGGWVLISAVVFRRLGAEAFAILALVRATIGLLNYATAGLPQALIHYLPQVAPPPLPAGKKRKKKRSQVPNEPQPDGRIAYYTTAYGAMLRVCILAAILVTAYALLFNRIHVVPESLHGHTFWLVCFMGVGLLMRLLGDNGGAVLQTHGRIALDNLLLGGGELLWVVFSIFFLFRWGTDQNGLLLIGLAYYLANFLIATVREQTALKLLHLQRPLWPKLDRPILYKLLSFGGLVVLAQLADYLYAPADYILINRLLWPGDLANYVPAIQIDAGLMLLVTAMGAVLLPKSALAHAAGDAAALRRYYIRGTLASLAMLIPAAVIIGWMSPHIFTVWLGNSMPMTQAILPWVLVHSVVGGSSAPGRGVLIGMGKVGAFSVAVLISGVVNVVLSFVFVKYARLGLDGIVLATIIAVVLRCAIWMPWYVLRVLRHADREAGGVS